MRRRITQIVTGPASLLPDGTLRAILEATQRMARRRWQQPKLLKRIDVARPYWYCRYRADVLGKEKRKRPVKDFGYCDEVTETEAKAALAEFVLEINDAPKILTGQVPFQEVVELWKERHLNNKNLVAASTKAKYLQHLKKHILPRFEKAPIGLMDSLTIETWLGGIQASWATRTDILNILSGIFTKARKWKVWTGANPCEDVEVGRKRAVRVKRILSEADTALFLSKLPDRYALVVKIALFCGGLRISEILALQWGNVDLKSQIALIDKRWWRGDLSATKSDSSTRVAALSLIADDLLRLRPLDAKPDDWVFPRKGNPMLPMTDSAVRKELKTTARDLGLDFPGFGIHRFRAAYITYVQEQGASAIEASKSAGHSKVQMSMEYTAARLARQQELTSSLIGRFIGEPEGTVS